MNPQPNVRNRAGALLFGVALFSGLLQAQPTWKFSGYVVQLPIYEQYNSTFAQLLSTDQNQFLDLTRLRLRPSLFFGENTWVGLEYEITFLYHTAPSAFWLTSQTTRRQAVDLRWYPILEPHVTASHFIDRLYFRQNFTAASIVVGRQRIAWGTGRIWNPTDLFNPINPASFDKIEKDGADAVSATYYFGSFTDLEAVYNAEDKFKQSNAAARFRTNVAEYDVSMMAGVFDKHAVVGGDFAGNFFTAGFRGEGILRFENDSPIANYILGLDYQFTPKLYALVEYQYNGEGKRNREEYQLQRLLDAEILNLARHYVAVSATYQLHPLVTAAGTLIQNFDDGSGFVSPTLTYSLAANIDLSLGGLLTYGSSQSEYWFYPTSLYLKGLLYF